MTVHANPDLETWTNNDTLAIRPTGRLHSFVQWTRDSTERCWLFANVHTWTDSDGNERFDHHQDGVRFLTECKVAGLRINDTNFHVPCSNGQKRQGNFGDTISEDPSADEFRDYHESELKSVRKDLPTVQGLLAAIVTKAA